MHLYTTIIISVSAKLFGKFCFSLLVVILVHRGLGVCKLYFADTSMYEKERESARVNICIRIYIRTASIVARERKGQNRTGVLQLLLFMHTRIVHYACIRK